MKKILALALIGTIFSVSLVSCKSSKGGKCDAYSSTVTKTQNEDLARK